MKNPKTYGKSRSIGERLIINWLLAVVEDMEMDITLDSNRNIMGIDRLKELKMHTQNQNNYDIYKQHGEIKCR